MVVSLQASARAACGFAMIADVTTHAQADSMESFFLSETLKYLFLLFDAGAAGSPSHATAAPAASSAASTKSSASSFGASPTPGGEGVAARQPPPPPPPPPQGPQAYATDAAGWPVGRSTELDRGRRSYIFSTGAQAGGG